MRSGRSKRSADTFSGHTGYEIRVHPYSAPENSHTIRTRFHGKEIMELVPAYDFETVRSRYIDVIANVFRLMEKEMGDFVRRA